MGVNRDNCPVPTYSQTTSIRSLAGKFANLLTYARQLDEAEYDAVVYFD